MSRKYLNDRWCVRCPKTDPTPYLRDNLEKMNIDKKSIVLDLGCGNGRNTKFLKLKGFKNIKSIDMAGDFGKKMVLGVDDLPCKNNSVGAILCNYVFMFLNKEEQDKLLSEIKRVASDNCCIMIEIYPAKDSETKNQIESDKLQKKIFQSLGWNKIRYSQNRFIAKNDKNIS